ncbi:DUF3168 domain-containing protein [Parvularcula sp. LCG005]|uniref:DUF3168 domain-containing protein n=1 Tax=Parvularcula sp. LCG005 TaxID=3078805 RepID=UPI002942371C|nr:DUF3168 domain-containing protein [Parvularcula sp. LCG005]WOI53995.1 DUF3168 domain-containing protein [Parvularcula sp. LCG005]
MTLPASWAVQVALYDLLRNDAELQAVASTGVQIHDSVPDEPTYPFITVGEAKISDYPGLDGAREHDIRLHIYSKWGGRQEVRTITDLLQARLHDAVLPLDGHRLSQCRFAFADIFRPVEAETFHGVARFRLVTEPLTQTV